jgi:hypothetical protein
MNDAFEGLGKKTSRPRQNAMVDVTRLALTPVEGFILSRVDGQASYEEICRISGLPAEQTLAILKSLKNGHVILGEGESPPPSATIEGDHSHSRQVHESHGHTPAPTLVTNDMLKKAHEKATGEIAIDEVGLISILERLDDGTPVAPADLIEAPDLSRETKERIVRLHRRIKKLDPYELLGVSPDADRAATKRVFSAASKELHPDRYYGKNLGSFKSKLATIFARMTEAMQSIEKARKEKKP